MSATLQTKKETEQLLFLFLVQRLNGAHQFGPFTAFHERSPFYEASGKAQYSKERPAMPGNVK